MSKKGGGKGGKGGPKGGKGPIMECAAEDEWTGEGLAGDEDLAGEAGSFDSIGRLMHGCRNPRRGGYATLPLPTTREADGSQTAG